MRVNNVSSSSSSPAVVVHEVQESYHLNDLVQPSAERNTDTSERGGGDEDDDAQGGVVLWQNDWKLTVGTSVVAVLVPPLSLCHGLLAVQMLRTFPGTSWTAVAGWDAVMLAVWSLMGPLTVILHRRFSSRVLAFAGGFLLASGLSLSMFASHLVTLYATLGILASVGASLAENTGGRVINRCLHEPNNSASKLSFLFRTLGQIAMPQCLSILFVLYNFPGALLVFGAVTLNVCAAALLFPTLGRTRSRNLQKGLTNGEHEFQRRFLPKTLNKSSSNHTAVKHKKSKTKTKKKTRKKSGIDATDDCQWRNPGNEGTPGRQLRSLRIRTFSLDSSRMLPDIPEEQEPVGDDESEDEVPTEEVPCIFLNHEERLNMVPAANSTKRVRQESETSTVSFASSTSDWESSVHSSQLSLSSVYSNSSLSLYTDSLTDLERMANFSLYQISVPTDEIPQMKPLWHVLKDSVLWLIAISCSFHNLVNCNMLLYIPIQTDREGLTTEDISHLLSLYVAGNVLGRIFATWLYNVHFQIQTVCTTMGLFALISISVHIFTDHLLAYYICSPIFGFTSGGCNALISPIIIRFIPHSSHSQAVAVLQLLQSFTFLLGVPLIGFLVEKQQQCVYAFSVLVLLQGISVMMWAFLPLAERCRSIREETARSPDIS